MKTVAHILTEFNPAMYSEAKAPLVSLYMETHRNTLEIPQDKLRFKNLLSQAETLLKQSYQRKDYESLLAKLDNLLTNPDEKLWRCAKEGLAVLASNDEVYVYYLDYSVKELAVVADSYHIKPLIRNFQYGSHYYLLELSADAFELYYGDFKTFEKVTLPPGVFNRLDELFDDFDNRVSGKSGSYGKTNTNFFGYEPKNDRVKIETEKLYHYINEVIHKHLILTQPCPIILVGLEQNQALFRSVSHHINVLSVGITKRFESMTQKEIVADASHIIEDMQREEIRKQLDSYGFALSQENASSDPRTIAVALAQRKVATLFIEGDSFIPGAFDPTAGTVSYDSGHTGHADDLADDFAQATYLQGGEVYVLNHDQMPSDTGVAALFRY